MNKLAAVLRESHTARFLIPAGIIFIIFGIMFMNASIQNKDYLETEATVTHVQLEVAEENKKEDTTYTVDLRYTVNGKEYEAELAGVSKCEEGDKMKIYYNPSDPSQITQTKSMLIPLVIILAGIAALFGGIISGAKTLRKFQKMNEQEELWTNAK